MTSLRGHKQEREPWERGWQIYWNKRKHLHKKGLGSTPTGFVWNMAAVSLFLNTNMAAVMSCESALQPE